MILLLVFAMVAGVATVLSPCILPVLPVVLASTLGSSRWRPLGVVLGLVVSFAFFTLALTTLVSLLNISVDVLRLGGAVVIGLFGLVLLVPSLKRRFETLSGRLAGAGGAGTDGGFASGAAVGASLGLVWAPCAGPILAAVTTVVATNRVSLEAVALTVAYAIGAGIPMLLIAYGGRRVVSRVRVLNHHTERLQRAFALVMVAFAFSFFFGFDRQVQAALVQSVPVEYTNALIALEDNPGIREQLDLIRQGGSEAGTALSQREGEAPAEPSADSGMAGGGGQAARADEAPGLPDASAGLGGSERSARADRPSPSQAAPATPAPTANPKLAIELDDYGPAPELRGIVGWINTEPTTLAALRGKVVIVDFWTYSCINCIRTLPYLNGWHEKYANSGLVILGVHTPEFEFEKSRDNVVRAVQQHGIKYPVAQDNAFATWNAYNNRYWPAKYIVDASGRVRYVHFGEGAYEETEAVIQKLLLEAGASAPAQSGGLAPYSLTRDSTPEIYIGAGRQEVLASPEKYQAGKPRRFTSPPELSLHHFAFQGEWTVREESALASAGARLDLRFSADDVYMVLTPGPAGEEIEVMLDGKTISTEQAGADVRDGVLSATAPKLYHLVDLRGSPGEHRLALLFRKGGTEAYTFTFG